MDSLTHYVSDARFFIFDYSNMPEILAGDTISSAVVTVSPSGLTIGAPGISGQKVQVLISGGSNGINYTVKCVATTAAGAQLTGIMPIYAVAS